MLFFFAILCHFNSSPFVTNYRGNKRTRQIVQKGIYKTFKLPHRIRCRTTERKKMHVFKCWKQGAEKMKEGHIYTEKAESWKKIKYEINIKWKLINTNWWAIFMLLSFMLRPRRWMNLPFRVDGPFWEVWMKYECGKLEKLH